MAQYPIKMLKDENGTPFVPLVAPEAVKDSQGTDLQSILDTKLEKGNIIAGSNITLSVSGNNITINSTAGGATTNIIDNLNQSTGGVGVLDAHQGYVLKGMIPGVQNSLTSTSTTDALSAYQGYLLSNRVVPTGGTANQVLAKNSVTDNDLKWVSLASVATSGSYSDLFGKPTIPTVTDNVTSTSTTDALSAKQGKVLNESKINISDIVDNCTTNDASKVLSAKQGRALNDKFGNYVLTSSIVNNLTSTSTNVPLSAAQGKALNDKLTNLSSTTLTASSKITSPSYYMGEYQIFGVKAWAYVKVSGTTPTLVAGGNISSVVRTQVGTYKFTFTKAMPNANYAAVASAECEGIGHEIIGVYQHSTTSVIVDVTDVTPALNDPVEINLIVVG